MELRERKTPSGKTSFFIDYRQDKHRRREILKGISDKEDAEVAFAAFKVAFSREAAGRPTKQGATVGEVMEAFLESKESGVSIAYYALLKQRAAEIVKHFGGEYPVRSLTEKNAADFRRVLIKKDDKRKGRKEGQTPVTVNAKVNLLKAAMDRAVKQGWIAKNPLAGIQNISDTRGPQWRYLNTKEVERLIDVFTDGIKVKRIRKNGRNYETTWKPSKRLFEIVIFLLNTGARLGEAQSVYWRDIDLERGLVRLNTTKHAARGRAAKARYIPVNQALRELLEGMKKADGPLFDYGHNLGRDFDMVCKKAKLGHVRIHDLRHTFASGLAMAGVPLNTIRELLGHTTLDMTLRYAHLAPSATAEAVQTLNFGAKRKAAKIVAIAEAN